MSEIRQQIELRIAEFREWRSTQELSVARLVQYCGVECIGGIDVGLDEAEQQIRGCLEEGFGADWHNDNGRLYICIYESLDETPDWMKVIAEKSLVDVEAILRAAGLDPKTENEQTA